ncbi:MAG: hypothetical protein J6S67_26020 [Methanobrevibacter sp.]|nr:hypothetical protein [Methanobrevibacter sp.]
MPINHSYTITFHFDGTTLTSCYDSEEDMNELFDYIQKAIASGTPYFLIKDDTIINLNRVMCVTKGETDTWKSVSKH